MSKVITYSTRYPITHPLAGQPTFFAEKILAGLAKSNPELEMIKNFSDYFCWDAYENCTLPKGHTIRAGTRWKVGDKFSPRIWTGMPYKSKQLAFCSDLEVKKVWHFEMIPSTWKHECIFVLKDSKLSFDNLSQLANNDGLTLPAFIDWFAGPDKCNRNRKPFYGQVICWDESIEY